MRTEDLDYDLPPDRIATQPAHPRDAARLMVIWRRDGRIAHHRVSELADLTDVLAPGDRMVFNRTRVLPARFEGSRRGTGGRVSGLYLESAGDDEWQVMLEAGGRLTVGESIDFDDESGIELVENLGQGRWRVSVHSPHRTLQLLERVGTTPLPPYIRNQRQKQGEPPVGENDATRYNTVFASAAGSIAAPTAGLHFTRELLGRLQARGIDRSELTLHIGAGTFMPVRTDVLEEHRMHAEWMHVPAGTLREIESTRRAGGRIVPVGTTTVRALESLPAEPLDTTADVCQHTELFIRPGAGAADLRYADALLTNFHLPRSTLLALVAALPGVGLDRLKQWYAVAVDEGYRFYSYGDAMLLL